MEIEALTESHWPVVQKKQYGTAQCKAKQAIKGQSVILGISQQVSTCQGAQSIVTPVAQVGCLQPGNVLVNACPLQPI
jgi:hypothetical protein